MKAITMAGDRRYFMKRTEPFLRNSGPRWLLAVVLSACSVHEHELTPYEKDAHAAGASAGTAGDGVGGASGAGQGGAGGASAGQGGASGSTQGGASGAGILDGSAGDTEPIADAAPDLQDGSNCIPQCPPTTCGTISNDCGATLACGPCQLSSTFANVAGVKLTTPRYAAAIVRIGNYVYVLGGYNNGTYLSTIERATVDVSGNLSNFSDAGISLVLARSGHTVLFIDQRLYVVGGLSISYTPTVERAAVDGNGILGAFATVAGVTLTTARGGHGSTVIGHNDYIIGGGGDAVLDNLESATFSSTGDLSTFTPLAGVNLSTKRLGFGSVTVGQWLYVLGGVTEIETDAALVPRYLTNVERAPFDQSAITGTFAALPSVLLAVPRYKAAAFAFGVNLYAIGGTNDVSGTLASVEQGTIDARGDVTGPFTVSGTIALSSPRAGAAFLLVPPWLYAIGGHNNAGDMDTVERASVE